MFIGRDDPQAASLDAVCTLDCATRRDSTAHPHDGHSSLGGLWSRRPEPGPSQRGQRGRPGPTVATVSVSSNPAPAVKFPQSPGGLIKVLYLAANPVDPANPGKQRLRVEEEFREIQQTVSQSRERDNIRLESRWAVQPHDITEALFAVEPHFVHFAGHGDTKEGSIVVGDEYGYARTIPVDGVVRAFQAAGQVIRCVVVNACGTERLAQALAAAGLCVIGMRQPVGDQSAVRFSIGFYQALAAGRSIETAFGAGVAQLMMTPLGDDARAPFLLCGGQAAR